MGKLLSVVIGYALSNFVFRLLASIGIGFFAYSGVDSLLQSAINFIQRYISQLPSALLDILSLAEVPQALSIIVSALLTASMIMSCKIFIGKA